MIVLHLQAQNRDFLSAIGKNSNAIIRDTVHTMRGQQQRFINPWQTERKLAWTTGNPLLRPI